MYTLFYAPGSASMLVHLALLETGAPYELERVDLSAGAQRNARYLALNPEGVVPTMLIDGRPLTESTAQLQVLAERHPASGLAPAVDGVERESWQQWVAYLSNPLAATFRLWFYPDDLGSAEHAPAARAALQRRIEGCWTRLDGHLAAHGPYLLGARCSGADLMATMLMRWSRNMPRPATAWPALAALATAVRERASWQRMSEIEGLTGW